MKSRLALSILAAALLTATPALADDAKTEAILGGKSKLAAILAEQAVPVPAASATRGSIPLVQAAMRDDSAAPLRPASLGRPDVFGSTAIPMRATALDASWARVSDDHVGGAAGGYAARVSGMGTLAKLEAINRYVNGHVRFIDDSRQFGVADRWSSAAETFATGRGDCEDYALAKMAMARRAGIDDKDLYLVVLKDLVRRADHAVLVVRAEGRFLVLDNGTDLLVDSDRIHDYRPVLTFTRGHKYTHGYRRDTVGAPVIMASAGRIDTPARPEATADYAVAENRALPVSIFAAPVPASAPIKR